MDVAEIDSCHALAEQLCNTGDNGCRWYHGNWHLLKALRIVSTSAIHSESITGLLSAALAERRESDGNAAGKQGADKEGKRKTVKILLSGSTDETLLRLVRLACQTAGVDSHITALDICSTPLAFMETYAQRSGIEFTSIRTDVLEFVSDERFDIILTHAFMGNFDDAGRVQLIDKWQELLTDRGKIVTIQRVRSADSPSIVRFSPHQQADFVKAAMAAATQHETSIGFDLKRVKQAASAFAENFSTYAVRSKSSLEKLFLDAGLVFSYLEYHTLAHIENLSGPSVPSSGEYVHIIAERARGKDFE